MPKRMIRVKVKVHNDSSAYIRIVHQHLRYAYCIDITETPTEGDYIEFIINPPKGVAYDHVWAKRVAERIKSFGDYAEVIIS